MITQTFQVMRSNVDVYGDIIPESLQTTINEWYDSRHVCDNDNFVRFFQRVLRRDYHRYNELLRIEAGAKYDTKAGYDWLVTSYLERELKVDGTSHEASGNTTTYTPGVRVTVQDDGETDYGNTSTLTHGLKSQTTYGRRDVLQTESTSDEGSVSSGNNSAVSKDLPASNIGTYSPSTNSTVELDNSDIDITLGRNASFDSELSYPSAVSKADSNTIGHTIRKSDGENSNQASGTDSTQNSGNDVTAKTGKDETSRTTITSKTGEDVTGVEGSSDLTDSKTTHEIYTGRGGAPAELLEKAKAYIETTSAWEWFSEQLEPCFMGVYDI